MSSVVGAIADAIRYVAAVGHSPLTEAQIDQLIADTVSRLWPPVPQLADRLASD